MTTFQLPILKFLWSNVCDLTECLRPQGWFGAKNGHAGSPHLVGASGISLLANGRSFPTIMLVEESPFMGSRLACRAVSNQLDSTLGASTIC